MRAVIFNRIGWCTLLLVMLATAVDAQRRGGTTRRRTATSATPTEETPVVNPATGNAVTPPPAPPASQRPDGISAPLVDTPRKSLRVDGVVERNLARDRTPIAYDYIREDDRFWEKEYGR